MGVSDDRDEFVQSVNASQRSLYAYVLTLVPHREDAYDILQEANLAVWQSRDKFVKGTNFHAWARQIAYHKVLMHRRKMRRDRLCFDDSLVDKLTADAGGASLFDDEWLKAMWRCVEKLALEDRTLLEQRYAEGLQARHIADQTGRSAGAVAQALYRIRLGLMHCIDEAISSGNKD